jgi:hypothetical protein
MPQTLDLKRRERLSPDSLGLLCLHPSDILFILPLYVACSVVK